MVERNNGQERHNGHEKTWFARQPVDINSINTLDQPRKTFDDSLSSLADSIATVGLISPLVVDRLDENGIFPQLEAMNRVWNTKYTPRDLVGVEEDGKPIWYLLVAGERRLRASRILLNVGCSECNERHGPGGCYERHFGSQNIEASVCTNISPVDFFKLQASENTHRAVPAQEEAGFYERFYKALRAENPDYPLVQFARDMGRSPSTIREALRYCNLPTIVQQFVENGSLPYGVATQLARLHEELHMPEGELVVWAQRAFVERLTVKKAREIVTRCIEERTSNQGMLFLFSPEQVAQQQKRRRRRVLGQETHLFLRGENRHLESVARLVKNGQLDREDSPFSAEGTRSLLETVIGTQKELLETENGLIKSPKKNNQLRSEVDESEKLLKEIDRQDETVVFDGMAVAASDR